MKTPVAALLLLLATASGCLETPPTGSDGAPGDLPKNVDVWATIRELMKDVPCQVPAVGAQTTPNLKLLANVSFDGRTHGEVDVRGDLAIVARYATGGFEILNVSNPAQPVYVGNFTEARGALDVKFSPDNATVLVGQSSGIVLADVRDAGNATKVGEWTFPGSYPGGLPGQNAHMIYTALIGGEQWVFLAPNSNTGVWILKLEGPPEKRSLRYVTNTLPVQGHVIGPHDMYVAHDADLNKWLLYSADGFHGWSVFDVSDPAKPLPLGGLVNPAEAAYTHTIQAAKIGNRRIVATIAEVGANVLKVYDATLLQAPLLLGVWQAAPGPGSANPQHNFNIVAGKLYLAHYDLGVYVFDLSKLGPAPVAGTLDLKPMAHFATGSGTYGPLAFAAFWDVVLKNGILYANHMTRGLHVIGFGCNEPGDPALTSTG